MNSRAPCAKLPHSPLAAETRVIALAFLQGAVRSPHSRGHSTVHCPLPFQSSLQFLCGPAPQPATQQRDPGAAHRVYGLARRPPGKEGGGGGGQKKGDIPSTAEPGSRQFSLPGDSWQPAWGAGGCCARPYLGRPLTGTS